MAGQVRIRLRNARFLTETRQLYSADVSARDAGGVHPFRHRFYSYSSALCYWNPIKSLLLVTVFPRFSPVARTEIDGRCRLNRVQSTSGRYSDAMRRRVFIRTTFKYLFSDEFREKKKKHFFTKKKNNTRTASVGRYYWNYISYRLYDCQFDYSRTPRRGFTKTKKTNRSRRDD